MVLVSVMMGGTGVKVNVGVGVKVKVGTHADRLVVGAVLPVPQVTLALSTMHCPWLLYQ